MKKIFWGSCLIFLNFHLNFNQYSLNILPDFVGWLLLFQGAKALEAESHNFKSIQPFTIGMAIYTAILWVGALLGMGGGTSGEFLAWLLGLLALIVSLYIAWVLIQGVLEMEARRAADLNSRALCRCWKGLAAVQAVGWLLGLLADITNVVVVAALVTALAAVGIVLIVLYLIAWWKAAKAWEELPPQAAGEELE